jgi:hypothetical protein
MACLISPARAEEQKPTTGSVVVLPVKGPVTEARFFFLRRALTDAEAVAASAIILDMDTPGGDLKATEKIVHKGIQLGFDSVIVLMKGIGYGKQSAVRSVFKAGFKVTRVEDRTSIAHNGCRPAKKRRT